jgi:hypothetical protein
MEKRAFEKELQGGSAQEKDLLPCEDADWSWRNGNECRREKEGRPNSPGPDDEEGVVLGERVEGVEHLDHDLCVKKE